MSDVQTIPVIVHGPAGCGKSRNAETLRKMLSCARIIDPWEPGDPIHRGALHLTYYPVRSIDCGRDVAVFAYDNLVYGEDFL